MNIKRLDDPTIPVASTPVGLIIYGMQGGQTVRVTPALLEGSGAVDGINGKSAYQVAIDNGFVGTQAQWLESLIGNSAYEDWVANGGVGTFQDFLDEIIEPVRTELINEVNRIVSTQHAVMTEAEFTALPVKNEDVIYLIIEE